MAAPFYASNDLEALAATLTQELLSRDTPVFQPWYVVTQTEGMNNWLRLQIAARVPGNIAANIVFLQPNELLRKAYRIMGGRHESVFHRDNLCWLLYHALGEEGFGRRYPSIAAYFSTDQQPDALKRMTLAEKLAALFDQYQVYRPDYVLRWNDMTLSDCQADAWQPYLWVRIKALAGHEIEDRTRMSQQLLRLLEDRENKSRLRTQMPAVHLFGISILTPLHIDILAALSETIDVCCYLQNPAPSIYWVDQISERQQSARLQRGNSPDPSVEVGNSLLLNWGAVMRETFALFFEKEIFINQYEVVAASPPAPDTLLRQLQRDIFDNAFERSLPPISQETLHDGSVSVQSCHTIAREVTALYNYLVHLIDKREENLSARDIVVMVQDIDAYAPYIKAIFDNAPYPFRYQIADERLAQGDNLAVALLSILHISEEGFTSESIVQLLDSRLIRARFGLTDMGLIRRAVAAAGIRFGISGHEADDTIHVSWLNGLRRLTFGICLYGEEPYEDDRTWLLPTDIVEGVGAQQLVGFIHFVEQLIHSVHMRQGARSIADWVHYINWVLQNLVFDTSENSSEDYLQINKQLTDYAAMHQLVSEAIHYEVFLHHFAGTLGGVQRHAYFLQGGVTFCSLIPMRSIPFRVVAVLGLNSSDFPRRETAISFNLLQDERRRGDRNLKENDKHLFLETILSARDYLYLSYIGQHVQDNAVLPPSTLLDELIDYLEVRTGLNDLRARWVTPQPLHGFSRRLNGADSRLYNYVGANTGSRNLPLLTAPPAEADVEATWTLAQLIQFLKAPIKTYFNQALGIYYKPESDLLPETEMFMPDGLAQWKLKNELLWVDAAARTAWMRENMARGTLPLKNMARYHADKLERDVALARDLLRQEIGDQVATHRSASLTLDGLQVAANFNNYYGDRLVTWSYSKSDYKYKLEGYVQYLAAVAAGLADKLCYISLTRCESLTVAGISPTEAHNRLRQLAALWQRGLQQPIPFFHELETDYDKIQKFSIDSFQEKLDDFFNGRTLCTDQYLIRARASGLFDGDKAFKQYQLAASLLVEPIDDFF